MAKEVNLLSYWMPILRNLKEFREIAKAEEPEIRALLQAMEQVLANMFIETADEDGIARFEKLLNIYPDKEADLANRRFTILSRWNNIGIYTNKTLYELLVMLCGEGNFKIIDHYKDYALEIITYLNVKDAFETVYSVVSEILPCNLVLELRNMVEEIVNPNLYIGGVVTNHITYSSIPSSTKVSVVNVPLYGVAVKSIGTKIILPTE